MTDIPTMPEHDVAFLADWFEERPINNANRKRQAQAIHDRLDFVGIDWATTFDGVSTGKQVKMLDYACGPGFLTKIYAPHVSSIIAIDLSPIMIEKYKKTVTTLGPATKRLSSVVTGNLLVDPPEPSFLMGEDYHNFDLLTVGAALHHFPSANEAIKVLAKRLKPGGVMLIADLYPANEKSVDMKETGHSEKSRRPHGYAEQEMEYMFNGAGLVGFKMEVLPGSYQTELLNEEVLDIQVFLARAMKPSK